MVQETCTGSEGCKSVTPTVSDAPARIGSTYVGCQDARIRVFVATRKSDLFTARGFAGLRTTDGQLDAAGVKLCAALGHAQLERNDFRAEQIVAWREGAGDGDVYRTAS